MSNDQSHLTRKQRQQIEKQAGVRSEWVVVTPELAAKWLNGNKHNRPIRNGVVERYAKDMLEGRWKQTHQGISFDERDTLIDGQHRLKAITEAGVPVLLLVTRGLGMDTQMIVDDGIKRNVVDLMRINDSAMGGLTAMHTAVATRMFYGTYGRSSIIRTRQEEAAFLKKHWDAINFTVGLFPVVKRISGVMSAPVLAVFARAFYHVDRELLVRAAEVLIEGLPKSEREHDLTKFRSGLMQRRHVAGGNQLAQDLYGKAVRVLFAYSEGIKLPRNIVADNADRFPVDGTLDTAKRDGARPKPVAYPRTGGRNPADEALTDARA